MGWLFIHATINIILILSLFFSSFTPFSVYMPNLSENYPVTQSVPMFIICLLFLRAYFPQCLQTRNVYKQTGLHSDPDIYHKSPMHLVNQTKTTTCKYRNSELHVCLATQTSFIFIPILSTFNVWKCNRIYYVFL